jgi:SAM-dependent methyltransferase
MANVRFAEGQNPGENLLTAETLQPNTPLTGDALVSPLLHDKWEKRYRTPSNVDYFRWVLAEAFEAFRAQGTSYRVLDAGCGTGVKALLLAEMGFSVLAVDKSEYVLGRARECTGDVPFSGELVFSRMDLCALDLEDASMDAVVCWASLMHIEAVNNAVTEVARVLKPGGRALVVEGNCHSVQSRTASLFRRLGLTAGRQDVGPVGLEIWKDTAEGRLIIRHMDIPALAELFAAAGLVMRQRRAGQFTEAYVLSPNGYAHDAIQRFNRYWYERMRVPGPAYSNVMVFEKKKVRDG